MTLKETLMRDEGLRLKLYQDMLEHPTIGYGRALDVKGITQEEAEVLLDHDIADAMADLAATLPWTAALDEIRLEALINMVFNMGVGNLLEKNPKFLALMKRGEYAAAAAEVLDGNWKDQVGPRAYRLARQLETGVQT